MQINCLISELPQVIPAVVSYCAKQGLPFALITLTNYPKQNIEIDTKHLNGSELLTYIFDECMDGMVTNYQAYSMDQLSKNKNNINYQKYDKMKKIKKIKKIKIGM